MGFQYNGSDYTPEINGVEAEEVQINGTTIWEAQQWVDSYSHGDINNYTGHVLYGSPYETFTITTSASALNDAGYALELGSMNTRGCVSTMPGDNLVEYYPDVGDQFVWRGWLNDYGTGDGADQIIFAFGLTSGDDQDNCIFLRYDANGLYFDIQEGWGNEIAGEQVWSSGSEPANTGFRVETTWNSGSIDADFYVNDTLQSSLTGSYSASKGRGIAWGGDMGSWQEALNLGAELA